tara:strand:- start:3083 stop:3646 length:564 start_codon:yes stop_codon:yes gene_type:complete
MTEYYISKAYIIQKIMLLLYYIQLYYNYLYNFLINYFNRNDILFVKDNKIIQYNNHSDTINIPKSDFCVISYKVNENQLIRVTDNYSLLDFPNMRLCNFNFILVTFISNNEEYDITKYLKNNNYTYYLQDATLFDNYFNKWFCMNHLQCYLDNITIKIIDHNANQVELNSNQYITLGSNTYHISEIS